MKKLISLFAFVLLLSTVGMAQQQNLTLSGGFVMTKVEDIKTDATGYRINGLYELPIFESPFSHGISFGYIHTAADLKTAGILSEFKMNNFPIYYAPKITFGNEKVKLFIKGALGVHFSNYKAITNNLEVTDKDFGFFGGGGLGTTIFINQNVFLTLEYEWDYLSNSWYRDGYVNSFMGGIGITIL